MSLSSESYFATQDQLDARRNGYGSGSIPELDDPEFGDIYLGYHNEAAADAVLAMYAEAIADGAQRTATVVPFSGRAAVKAEVTPMTAMDGRTIETVDTDSRLAG